MNKRAKHKEEENRILLNDVTHQEQRTAKYRTCRRSREMCVKRDGEKGRKTDYGDEEG